MSKNLMPFEGNLMTTGMGILPHKDLDRALKISMSVDIPFWPQLPKMSFFEDMYVQASENFPGIILEPENLNIYFDTAKFYSQLENTLLNFENPDFFKMSPQYSATYHAFLGFDLSKYASIRGQLEGPVSFGLKVLDENKKPIIFNEEVRSILFDFMARKANVQLQELKDKNPRAFLFIDEPGLQYIFSSVSGYTNDMAKRDFEIFFNQIEHPRGIHLCGNPDWDFLLNLDIDILSFNAYNCGEIFVKYKASIKRFLKRGGIIGWGLVPANYEEFQKENKEHLIHHIENLWGELVKEGFDLKEVLTKSILMPATCALLNPDEFKTVEEAYNWLNNLSHKLREKYKIV
ncbi:MAG: hypothetical protein N2202_00285 [Proteobacteria bacterium]|nr:hypothetical protein [Pseudomonadota bacterium]